MTTVRPTPPAGWELTVQVLLAGRALVDELHRRLAADGHDRLRPAHGFLFQALGVDGATASELGARLGVTKQAARLMVEELLELGYVERGEDEADARRRPVRLTARGAEVLRRSEEILGELRRELAGEVGERAVGTTFAVLAEADRRYGPAPLRPAW